MAARPLLRHLCKVIEEQGGDDVILDRIAAGEPVRSIVKDYINPRTNKPFTHPMLYHWRNKGGEERKRAWAEAQAMSSYAHVEEAGEIQDEASKRAGLTSADAGIVKARAEYKKWLASMYNKEEFGEQKQLGGTNIQIGTLHLGALQQAGNAKALTSGGQEVLEAEVVVEEDDD